MYFAGNSLSGVPNVPIKSKSKKESDESLLKMSAVASSGPTEALVDEDGNEIKAPKESWYYLFLIVFIGVCNYWQ